MKRKLIKQGVGGLTVCLPKKWTEANHLQGGEEIEIAEEQHTLVLSAKVRELILRQELLIENYSSEFLSRILTNAYKRGVDELKLIFKKEIPTKNINEILGALTIGYEITEIGKGYCIIRNFSREEEENIEITVRKCFLLIKEMNTILIEDLTSKKYNNSQALADLNNNVRKLANYTLRTGTKIVKDNALVQHQAIIFSNVSLFSTKIKYIYNQLHLEKKISPATKKMIEKLSALFNLFYDSYYLKKLTDINRIITIKQELTAEIEKNINSGNGKILLQAGMALRCVHDSVGALMGTIMKD